MGNRTVRSLWDQWKQALAILALAAGMAYAVHIQAQKDAAALQAAAIQICQKENELNLELRRSIRIISSYLWATNKPRSKIVQDYAEVRNRIDKIVPYDCYKDYIDLDIG